MRAQQGAPGPHQPGQTLAQILLTGVPFVYVAVPLGRFPVSSAKGMCLSPQTLIPGYLGPICECGEQQKLLWELDQSPTNRITGSPDVLTVEGGEVQGEYYSQAAQSEAGTELGASRMFLDRILSILVEAPRDPFPHKEMGTGLDSRDSEAGSGGWEALHICLQCYSPSCSAFWKSELHGPLLTTLQPRWPNEVSSNTPET